MAGQFDLDDILARNPHIDPGQVEEAKALLRHLKEAGVQRKGYTIGPQFGRRARVKGEGRTDPRVIRLRQSRSTSIYSSLDIRKGWLAC